MRNADEIAYWNASAGDRWAKFQDRIDRMFEPLTGPTLAAAAAQRGERVLDVGCGCAATSLALASAVGVGGTVVGIDVSQPMLALGERRATALNRTNLRFVLGDAATEAFEEEAYDLIFSRFGVMFFDDPVGAFTNIRKSLRSNGRLAFACWRELAANPWFAVPVSAVRPHVPEQPKPDPTAPGPLAFADAERVRGILEGAGFGDVRFERVDAPLFIGNIDEAIEFFSQIGPAARLLDDADDPSKQRALAALRETLATYERDGQVALGGGIWIVRASAA